MRELLTAPQPRPGETEAKRQARIKEARANYWPQAAALSQMLLGPAASQLGAKRLLIVADGALQYLPFGALPVPDSHASTSTRLTITSTPLMVEHEIVHLPSASALAVLRRELAGRQPAAKVVQTALRNVIEPIFEVGFAAHSYGFRPGRGCLDALRRVEQLLDAGYTFVVDADLKSYFDTIPHAALRERVETKIADGRMPTLLDAFLKQEVMSTIDTTTPEAGTPQGAVISPLLSNIYLDPLDQMMAAQGWEMVRYADDFVILCRSQAEAERALQTVREWTAQAGLTLHPEPSQSWPIRSSARMTRALSRLTKRRPAKIRHQT